MRRIHKAFMIVIILAIGFLGLFLWKVKQQKQPQFFPFNETAGEYRIISTPNYGRLKATVFEVEYKGPNNWKSAKTLNGPMSGDITITVGKTHYDLSQYLGKRVNIKRGEFVGLSEQCVNNKCLDLGSSYAVVNIDELEVIK